jgi:acyl carrier protein
MTTRAGASFGAEDLAEVLADIGFPVSAADLAQAPATPFSDWGLDSLAQLELAAVLERRLGLRIEDDEAASLLESAQTTLEHIAAWQDLEAITDGRAH